MVSGSYTAATDLGEWRLSPGEGIIYPSGIPHQGHLGRDGTTLLMLLAWTGTEPTTDGKPMSFADPSGFVRVGLHWLHALPQSRDERTIEKNALTIAVLEQVHWSSSASESSNDPIAETHRFLKTSGHLTVDMALLATRTGLAIPTINRRFRERYGIPPMQFLQRVRAQHAAALVASTTADLTTIARQVGLQSGSHLSRLLKKHLGSTARELRGRR